MLSTRSKGGLFCGSGVGTIPLDQGLTPWVTASCANPSQLTDLIHGQPPSPRLSATPSDLFMFSIWGHPVRKRYAQYRDKTLDKRNTDKKNRAWVFTPQISTSPRGDIQAPGSRTMRTAVQWIHREHQPIGALPFVAKGTRKLCSARAADGLSLCPAVLCARGRYGYLTNGAPGISPSRLSSIIRTCIVANTEASFLD